MSKFLDRLRDKGYTVDDAAERWGWKRRRMYEIAANPQTRHLDMLAGIPDKRSPDIDALIAELEVMLRARKARKTTG